MHSARPRKKPLCAMFPRRLICISVTQRGSVTNCRRFAQRQHYLFFHARAISKNHAAQLTSPNDICDGPWCRSFRVSRAVRTRRPVCKGQTACLESEAEGLKKSSKPYTRLPDLIVMTEQPNNNNLRVCRRRWEGNGHRDWYVYGGIYSTVRLMPPLSVSFK